MTWLTKDLTLDLLAIAIDGLQKSFDRIANEPDGTWPPADIPAAPAAAEAPAPLQQPAEAPAPQEKPADPQPETSDASEAPEAPNLDALRTEAQNVLRAVVEHQDGVDWVTGTLFPKFGIESLTDLTPDRYPDLIAEARAHLAEQEGSAAA